MKTRSLIGVAFVCLLSCIALAQQVNVDWQRGTDFSKYKTYAWGVGTHPIQDSLWNQRIIGMVDAQLAAKGLQKVSLDQNPGLIVVYNAGVQQNVSYQGYATGWFNRMGSINQVVENEGTLVVDLLDPQQKMTVWRGMAEQTLSDKSDKNISKVQKMVTKMFQKYPPQG
ncbi:MAG TPA: DUF4136 domain-containing protein [Terriglobales bacterium]|jgi:hypothetical protein|nr:DUF4136 domain-containing protein [Terriglobales bacterium]